MGIENIELLKSWGFDSSDNESQLAPVEHSDTITATIEPTI